MNADAKEREARKELIDDEAEAEAKKQACTSALSEEIPEGVFQFATMDWNILSLFDEDEDLKPFLPLLSHRLSLTNIDGKEKRRFQLEVDQLVANLEVFMEEDEWTVRRQAKMHAAAEALKILINDSKDGFKLQQLMRKVIEFNRRQQEKPKGRFGF